MVKELSGKPGVLDEQQKRQILGGNAQKLYGLPAFEKKLATI
jgi:hypothetical protein